MVCFSNPPFVSLCPYIFAEITEKVEKNGHKWDFLFFGDFSPIFWISGFFYSVDGQGSCNTQCLAPGLKKASASYMLISVPSRRVHSIVDMGGAAKAIRRSNSLSRSAFSVSSKYPLGCSSMC